MLYGNTGKRIMTSQISPNRHTDELFLPDFCAIQAVFLVVLIAELLAAVLALSPLTRAGFSWSDFGLVSLFIQWVALTSAASLCAARPLLRRFDNVRAGVASYLILMFITTIISEAAFWITHYTGAIEALPRDWHLSFIIRNLSISAIVSAVVLRYLYIQHQWKRNIESESRSRVEALQARIRPHFLFNSMNTIASLTRSQPAIAEEAVEDLSDLFRASLADGTQRVSLGSEFELTRRYLRIEKLRLGDRLSVEWQVDTVPQDALIPALTLQPLLENAIYHGLESIPGGGCIKVGAAMADGQISITIHNPLPVSSQASKHQGHNMALENVRERLQVFFNSRAHLTAEPVEDGYVVTLSFPYQDKEAGFE